MPFTKPLWSQGKASEVMSPEDIERDAAKLRHVEALIPLDKVKEVVEHVLEAPLRAASGLPLFDDIEIAPDQRNTAQQEFQRIAGELARPNYEELAKLAREQIVRYWVKVLWSALERRPQGVHLGTTLLPEKPDDDWKKDRQRREEELLEYLPLTKSGLQNVTRVFIGAMESALSQKSIELPRGMRVTLKQNQELVVYRGQVPTVSADDIATDGNQADV